MGSRGRLLLSRWGFHSGSWSLRTGLPVHVSRVPLGSSGHNHLRPSPSAYCRQVSTTQKRACGEKHHGKGGSCVLRGIDSSCPWLHPHLLINTDNLFWTPIATPVRGSSLVFPGCWRVPQSLLRQKPRTCISSDSIR